jgi:hypothetical protein
MRKFVTTTAAAAALLLAASHSIGAEADEHQHMHEQHMHGGHDASSMASETRQMVSFPEPLRIRTMAHMRDHLLAISEIQEALAQGQFDRAAEIAESRLGMSSMALHGADEVARYMPEGMRAIGSGMHRAASRLALAARDAAVSNDVRQPVGALSDVVRQCIACHAAYRAQ